MVFARLKDGEQRCEIRNAKKSNREEFPMARDTIRRVASLFLHRLIRKGL